MTRWVDLGRVADLRFQPGAPVKVEGRWIAVFPLDGGYTAIDNACPHASAPLCDGTVLDGHVVCALHLWQFDLRTGACDVGEVWNVRHYEVRQVDDRLELALED
ncbi:MAG: Rieske (2Fe-2S) protein [Planctomycetes bacterium]|nr:Rieske (2Fe-2S) protein [Planctomycetota bacterium]